MREQQLTTHFALLILVSLTASAFGHGQMVFPPGRHLASLNKPTNCDYGSCLWYTTETQIPGESTLPRWARSMDMNATGDADVFKKAPWRAPGTAPVLGSGCGVAGGGDLIFVNGGNWSSGLTTSAANGGGQPPLKGITQGDDGLVVLPPQPPVVWTPGTEVEVGFGLNVNHGGGYSYRMCRNVPGEVNEECFQRNVLRFADKAHTIRYTDGREVSTPMTRVSEGTFPAGSEWARNPLPECNKCYLGAPSVNMTTHQATITAEPITASDKCGPPLKAVPGGKHDGNNETIARRLAWLKQAGCNLGCTVCGDSMTIAAGPLTITTNGELVETQFPVPKEVPRGPSWAPQAAFSVMDKVVVPRGLEPGKYLLSWRWDCEESTQVWQNCADIEVAKGHVEPMAVGEY